MVSLNFAGVTRATAASIILLSAVALSACTEQKAETKSVIRPVKVVEIARTGNSRELEYSGSVKSRTEMNLGFRVAGKVTERLVDIGDRVKPGDVLARMDPTDYKLAVNSATASLAAAEKAVETADLANRRAHTLFKKDAVPKAQVEQTQLTYDQAVSTRDAAAAALDQVLLAIGLEVGLVPAAALEAEAGGRDLLGQGLGMALRASGGGRIRDLLQDFGGGTAVGANVFVERHDNLRETTFYPVFVRKPRKFKG